MRKACGLAPAPPGPLPAEPRLARVRRVLTLREIGNSRFREGRGGDVPASHHKPRDLPNCHHEIQTAVRACFVRRIWQQLFRPVCRRRRLSRSAGAHHRRLRPRCFGRCRGAHPRAVPLPKIRPAISGREPAGRRQQRGHELRRPRAQRRLHPPAGNRRQHHKPGDRAYRHARSVRRIHAHCAIHHASEHSGRASVNRRPQRCRLDRPLPVNARRFFVRVGRCRQRLAFFRRTVQRHGRHQARARALWRNPAGADRSSGRGASR
jgi:hypothetical protein